MCICKKEFFAGKTGRDILFSNDSRLTIHVSRPLMFLTPEPYTKSHEENAIEHTEREPQWPRRGINGRQFTDGLRSDPVTRILHGHNDVYSDIP